MIIDLSSIIPAVSFILYIIFTIFAFYYQSTSRPPWSFRLYMLAMAVWSFGSFMMHANTGVLTPLFWNRFMVAGMLGGPITIYHSMLELSGLKKQRYYGLIYAGYGIYLFLLGLNFSGLIVSATGFEEGQFYYRLGPGAPVAYSLSYMYLILGIYVLLRGLRKTDNPLLRKKLKPPFFGAIIMLAGVLGNLYHPVGRYPVDLFAATLNAVLIFFSIYKYKLLNYSVFVLRVILYLILIVLSSFVFYGILFASSPVIRQMDFGYIFLLSLMLGVAASIIFQPLRKGTLNIIERIYLGRRLAYLNNLRNFSSSIVSITDLSALGDMTVNKIVETYNLEWAFIVGLDYATRNYRLLAEKGLDLSENTFNSFILPRDSEIVQKILGDRDVLLKQNGNSELKIRLPDIDLELHPTLILPLQFKERINGCIVLGKCTDKEYYNTYDIETLEILAGQCSVSLENAISFERLKKQQKRLQDLNKELIISRNKLEAFFDGITNPISIHDINYNIVTVNFAATKYFGKSLDDLIGQKCYRVFFKRDKPCEHCMAPDCLHTMLPFSTEVVEPRTQVVFSSQFYPIQMPADRDKLVLEFFQDITQQKRLQQELVQSEKLAGIGTLASGIAHEINNPLSGIIGTAEIMLDEMSPQSKLHEFTQDIIRYSESAAEIIQDLNKYSRQNGRGPEPVDIIDILENSLTMAKRGMDFDNITVRKRYEELPYFEANPNELQQVFLNIIINGIQAMKGSGELILSCEKVDGNACVSIRDTGYGIPAKDVDSVFTPFYTTKAPGKGTGLGLSVSHQLVQKMGGRIQIHSDIGRGTNFEIFIPLSEEVTRRIRFVKADTQQVIEDVFFLQRKILIGEKGYTEETIRREVDEAAVHFVAYKGLQPVGTVTCITPDMIGTLPIESHFPLQDHQEGRRSVEIDRLAVLREERGSIIPLGLMTIAYLYARANSAERVFLDVFSDEKKHISMYKKLGFQQIGDYTSPLPVTVMMLDQQTDYEKKAQRMEHFVRPFMARLKKYLALTAEDKSTLLSAMEEVVSGVAAAR